MSDPDLALSKEHSELLTEVAMQVDEVFKAANLSPAEKLLVLARHMGVAEAQGMLLGHTTVSPVAMHDEICARIVEERERFLALQSPRRPS